MKFVIYDILKFLICINLLEVTLGLRLIELSMPKIRIKRHAEYYASRKFQLDHVTPSNDFSEILDRNTDGPDEKSDTTDDLINVTASTGDTKHFQGRRAAKSRKPLRNRNKKDCEYDNKELSNSMNSKYEKLHGGNANNKKHSAINLLYNDYGGANLHTNTILDSGVIHDSLFEPYYTKGKSKSSTGLDSSFKNWEESHSYSPKGGNTHAGSFETWNGGHSKPTHWKGSHSYSQNGGDTYSDYFGPWDGAHSKPDHGKGSYSYSHNADSFGTSHGTHSKPAHGKGSYSYSQNADSFGTSHSTLSKPTYGKGSYLYSQNGEDTHSDSFETWAGGAHSKPNHWKGSQSSGAGFEQTFGSSSKTHNGYYNKHDDILNSGGGSYSLKNWDESDSDFKVRPESHLEHPKFEESSSYNDFGGSSSHNQFGEYSSNSNQHFGDYVIDDYTKNGDDTFSGGISSGGLPWGGHEHNNNNKNNRIINNNNNNNNNIGKSSKIINNNNNNNNNARSRIIPSDNKNGSSSGIIDTKEVDKKKKKKLALISFNSVHTNNNINNNNNAEGAVNFNEVGNSNKGNNGIQSGQNHCWFVVCVGLYVNDPKFSQLNENKTISDT